MPAAARGLIAAVEFEKIYPKLSFYRACRAPSLVTMGGQSAEQTRIRQTFDFIDIIIFFVRQVNIARQSEIAAILSRRRSRGAPTRGGQSPYGRVDRNKRPRTGPMKMIENL